MRVLVLDPGERVGWATGVITPSGASPHHRDRKPALLEVTGHGIAYLKDMALKVDEALAAGRYDVVVFEQWKLTARGARVSVGSEMESSQFIGMVRLCCWKYGVKIEKQQTKAMSSADLSLKCGHPSAADVAERIAKLPATHDESHDGSALRHLWTYFFEEYV